MTRRDPARARDRARASVAIGAVSLLTAGCLAPAVSAEGREIQRLYDITIAIAALVAIVVYGLATFAIVRYRVLRRRDRAEPRQVHGNMLVEVIWTAIPLLIVGGLFAGTLAVLARTEARTPAPAAEVHVQAFRWGWQVSYPAEGIQSAGIGPSGPEIVVPVGQAVRYVLGSDDVVHSFFVPRFLFKRDAVPGRQNIFEITVEEPGTYRGQCAEFCGVGHAAMPFTVRAVTPDEYAAWLETARSNGGGGSPLTPGGSPAGGTPNPTLIPARTPG